MTPGYSNLWKEERNKKLKTTILELSTAVLGNVSLTESGLLYIVYFLESKND